MNESALMLAAHGSRHDNGVNERVRQLAERVADALAGVPVIAAFHQGAPGFCEAAQIADARRLVVVPIMTSSGYYCDEVLPRELSRARNAGSVQITQTLPVGLHSLMAQIAVDRAAELCACHGFEPGATALLVVGHGTLRNRRSREAAEALVARIRLRGLFAEVAAVFLDEVPYVQQALPCVAADSVVVLPFMIGQGPHAARDIPRRIGLATTGMRPPFEGRVSQGHRAWRVVVDSAVGLDERVDAIVLDLAARNGLGRRPVDSDVWVDGGTGRSSDAGRTVLRIGTRASKMALWQARLVGSRLESLGHVTQIIPMQTAGDRDRSVAISALVGEGPFTDDIDEALRAGQIDMAVHCLKDLPLDLPAGCRLGAVLPRDDARECLVSRNGIGIAGLARGSVVGVSSARRRAQLLRRRPDLSAQNIRGPVESRIAQVHTGAFDAIVVALAGLQRLGMEHEASEIFDWLDFMPAPAQGALAINVRDDDEATQWIVDRLSDRWTWVAVRAELSVLSAFERRADVAVAAYATAAAGRVELHARLLALDGASVIDADATCVDEVLAAQQAIRALQIRCSMMVGVA